MAWLEKKGSVSRLRFRCGGEKHLVPFDTADEREANDCLSRFGEHFRLIRRGGIPTPPVGADVGGFILSGGKLADPAPTGLLGSRLSPLHRDAEACIELAKAGFRVEAGFRVLGKWCSLARVGESERAAQRPFPHWL